MNPFQDIRGYEGKVIFTWCEDLSISRTLSMLVAISSIYLILAL